MNRKMMDNMKCPSCDHDRLSWYSNRPYGKPRRFRCGSCYEHFEMKYDGPVVIQIPQRYRIIRNQTATAAQVGQVLNG